MSNYQIGLLGALTTLGALWASTMLPPDVAGEPSQVKAIVVMGGVGALTAIAIHAVLK